MPRVRYSNVYYMVLTKQDFTWQILAQNPICNVDSNLFIDRMLFNKFLLLLLRTKKPIVLTLSGPLFLLLMRISSKSRHSFSLVHINHVRWYTFDVNILQRTVTEYSV